jgi:hypothetical protein
LLTFTLQVEQLRSVLIYSVKRKAAERLT